MHEMGIISNIFKVVEDVAADNNIQRITKVNLRIGKLRQVAPPMLENAFAVVSEGTLARGARLEVEYQNIVMRCQSCREEFSVDDKLYICPSCEGTELTLLTGDEVMLESVEAVEPRGKSTTLESITRTSVMRFLEIMPYED